MTTEPAASPRMPITQADPHKGVAPTAYVWRLRRQSCSRCSFTFESIDLFAETWLRATGEHGPYGKPFRNYRPMRGEAPIWNLPVRTELLPIEHLAFCSECSDDALLALPKPAPNRVVGLFNSTFAEAHKAPKGGTTQVRRPAAPRAPASIADIAKDLGL